MEEENINNKKFTNIEIFNLKKINKLKNFKLN